MTGQRKNFVYMRLSRQNKYYLILISCMLPAVYFISICLFLGLHIQAAVYLLVFIAFLALYRRPLRRENFKAVFCGILVYAYLFELIAAFCLEWEMGAQNLLFALIPLCFSFIYMDDNYDEIIPCGILYSVLVVACYLLCSAIDFLAVPGTGATHLEIRIISAFSSILTGGMIFAYVLLFVFELHEAHSRLVGETNKKLDGMQSSMMLSQIKPHFLYNTIGAIEELIDSDPERAKRELETFARYMRMNIDTLSSQELIPFEKELAHIRSYIQIQNLRFGDTISVEYDIASGDFKLPPLTIQPIVENAVKHGFRPRGGHGTIRIAEREDADSHIVTVSDDGVGMDMTAARTASGSTGLANINYRIEQLCGGRMDMVSRPGCGTTVTVVFPKSDKCGVSADENDPCR